MELTVNYLMGDKYAEFTIQDGNCTIKSGLLTKKEATEFLKQFTDCIESVEGMWES